MTKQSTNQNTVDMHPNLEDVYELSPMQQGMLFHTLYSPGSGVYFEQSIFTIEGDFDFPAFQNAWRHVISRHSILRTGFVWEEVEKPLQIVYRNARADIEKHDWREFDAAQQQELLEKFIHVDQVRGFDLARPPLLRLALFRTGESTYKLIWSRHHLILDRWSRAIVLKEVSSLYESFRKGLEPETEEARPYGDYIGWLLKQDQAAAESFWRESLRGFENPTEISLGQGSSASQTYDSQSARLSSEATSKLRKFSREQKLTMNTLVQGAWSLLLSRYSGENDVVFGATVAGRPAELAGVERTVGLFINTLPVRVKTPSQTRLLSWLHNLQVQQADQRQYEYSSLIDIQSWSDVPRGVALFETILVFENLPVDASFRQTEGSLVIRGDRGVGSKTNYPLAILVNPGTELSVQAVYDLSRFDADSIDRLLHHFLLLLEQFSEAAERNLTEISLLDSRERDQLLYEWNNTERSFPRESCVHESIERQTARQPDNIAVVFGQRQLSYEELNQRANQLARFLAPPLGAESLVGIYLERGPELVVALLAVLKAGAAYVPLDTDSPAARLDFMIKDSGLQLIIAQQSLRERVSETGVPIVCLDAEREKIAAEPRTNLPNKVKPSNLAYVIYTSGSTGTPKAVEIPHSAVVNFLTAMQTQPGLTAADRLLAVTTLSFDIAGLEIYLPLTVGGRVELTSRAEAADGKFLRDKLASARITAMQATPATWRLLLEAGWEGDPQLKILCGGEALPRDLADALLQRSKSVWNMYGPTETTIWSAAGELELGDESVRLGQAIANTQLYVLDRDLNLAPIRVAGELYIGGQGLARGYRGQPALTAERFLPNPFANQTGARLYRTGDLVRRLANGELEFLGRIDHQVKIRGFRVETGEIESLLRQHPNVRESVVMLRGDESGNERLVAYVVADTNEGAADGDETLRAEQLSQWGTVWDEIYGEADTVANPGFNITGWNSSYTGTPIPPEEMSEWVNGTVQRIRGLSAVRVLEIGCGSGLLLFRLVPECEQYYGTDLSQKAIDYLKRNLDYTPDQSRIKLERRSAEDFSGIEAATFDAVILNSVVQYFPSIEYLLKVLEGAVRVVRTGGSIFIGDVRNLQLFEAFHTSVQLYNAPSSLTARELRQQIQKQVQQEKELLIDPAFFRQLPHRFPEITGVQVQLKRGQYVNELTRFRYDVTLEIGRPSQQPQNFREVDWQRESGSLTQLQQLIADSDADVCTVRNLPNARVHEAVTAVNLLHGNEECDNVADLRERSRENPGIDPEHVCALIESLGYVVDVTWSLGDCGTFDVTFRRPHIPLVTNHKYSGDAQFAWGKYANYPMRSDQARKLEPELRKFLAAALPEHMIPSHFFILDALPRTANGKLDRKALPKIDQLRPNLEQPFVAPRTPIEQEVARIWEEVLKVKGVGVHDNFFALGGHSLLATQVISRVNESLQIEMPLRLMFEHPAIAEFAVAVVQRQARAPKQGTVQFLSELSKLSDEEAQQLLDSQIPKLV